MTIGLRPGGSSSITLTSRSPYRVSASVRGIGVAVITSTSGVHALLHQPQPLQHAEAMLLVDDGEAQLLELDVLLEQRVRADDDVHQALGQQFLELHLLARR